MPSTLANLVRALAVVAHLTTAVLAQQTLAERAAPVEARLLEARAAAAEDAFERGLLREASMLARQVVESQPQHALAQRLAAIKAMTGEAYLRTYREAVAKSGRAFRKQLEKTLAPLAAELAALGEEGLAGDEAALGETLLARAYRIDPDNATARKALQKLDYDTIFNYGALPKEDKQAARSALKKLSGRFLERSDLKKELEFWSDAWGLQTRHYRFVTNAPHATVFAFAQACEDLHDAWDEFMRDNKQPLRNVTKPLSVYLFGSVVDYENVLRLQGEEPPDSSQVLGYYSPTTKTGHFYYDHDFYAGDTTLLFETFFHEGAHQLIDLRLKAAWRGPADDKPLRWVEEGLCVYLESLVTSDDGREHEFGTVVDDDLATAIEAAANGQLMPMAQFAHIGDQEWDAYEAGYPQAALVVHWLMHGDGGKRRATVFDLLVAERQNGGLRKSSFEELLGMDYAAIDAALTAHAAAIHKQLKIRTYAEPQAGK
ncbi:MAG: hypothetical protein H6838_09795 [Planctomycetes bacterium]|nr:hypothetical protein [Planctomycetota bacterium]MCB9885775.1 hypothetical protein [Planctomycetota bacterium]